MMKAAMCATDVEKKLLCPSIGRKDETKIMSRIVPSAVDQVAFTSSSMSKRFGCGQNRSKTVIERPWKDAACLKARRMGKRNRTGFPRGKWQDES